jgi:hypothetical protein
VGSSFLCQPTGWLTLANRASWFSNDPSGSSAASTG